MNYKIKAKKGIFPAEISGKKEKKMKFAASINYALSLLFMNYFRLLCSIFVNYALCLLIMNYFMFIIAYFC